MLASIATECIALAALGSALSSCDRRAPIVFDLAQGLHFASIEWMRLAMQAITDSR